MADLDRIKRNVAKMASQGAPTEDIDGYIESEGVTLDDVKNYQPGSDFGFQQPDIPESVTEANRYTDAVAESKPEIPWWESGLRGAGQGLSFGFSDELASGLEGIGGAISGEGFGSAYDRKLQADRAYNEEAQRQNPAAYIGGDIAGSVLPSVAAQFIPGVGQAATGANGARLLGTAGRMALGGAAGGALSGVGHSERPEDMLGNALQGGTIGAVTGGAAAPVGQLASKVGHGLAGFGNGLVDDVVRGLPVAGQAAGKIGNKIDEFADPMIDRLAAMNPKMGAAAGDFYNQGMGGGTGAVARGASLFDPTGTSQAALGGLAGSKAAGYAGDAAQSFAKLPGAGVSAGNVVGSNSATDESKRNNRNPMYVFEQIKDTPYQQQLWQAWQEGSEKYMVELNRLMQSDPQFRSLLM